MALQSEGLSLVSEGLSLASCSHPPLVDDASHAYTRGVAPFVSTDEQILPPASAPICRGLFFSLPPTSFPFPSPATPPPLPSLPSSHPSSSPVPIDLRCMYRGFYHVSMSLVIVILVDDVWAEPEPLLPSSSRDVPGTWGLEMIQSSDIISASMCGVYVLAATWLHSCTEGWYISFVPLLYLFLAGILLLSYLFIPLSGSANKGG